MQRAAVVSTVVEPLNRREYNAAFGGDILKKLTDKRGEIMNDMKERGLIPQNAVDPAMQLKEVNVSFKKTEDEPQKHSEFIIVQSGGDQSAGVQVTSGEKDLGGKLMRELERESKLADLQEERDKNH
jgi:hypothetical protein